MEHGAVISEDGEIEANRTSSGALTSLVVEEGRTNPSMDNPWHWKTIHFNIIDGLVKDLC